ncbi:isoleucine--tRNA ligase [Aquimarina sp. ERC-38]|uniref:isoleucine--tRNA ligase n=1 Tax=Aquimarina sp. ERC-38 TaxID=2949996 RepID=UPI002246BBD8|nr:isoleucine--tRNA ligase [Aquimarina sp. ERC-38]UZO82142.1 isoleucine--tRNA ligase [Aquimarina sp. ERC-38]
MSNRFTEYKSLDLPQIAEEVLQFWEENQIFEKSISEREGAEPFIFFEGPPSANGLPGIHHVMARAIKDIFCRFKTQKGYKVNRKAGWDTHGLPVELGVEKELGITKEDIGQKISVSEYNEACKKAVMRYTDIWNDLTRKIGYWVDMEDPYITYKSKYMETVWWLLSEIYKKGLLYKGYTIQPYSPKAGTGLSSHELNQPGTYQDVTDTTVVAQFKSPLRPLAPQGGTSNSIAKAFNISYPLEGLGAAYFLAWTTTPWTLPSNTALTVGPKIDYVLVQTYNQYTFEPTLVVLAKNLVSKQFDGKFIEVASSEEIKTYTPKNEAGKANKILYLILAECKGADLVDIRYEQLLDYVQPYHNPENAFRVIAGDFVTTEDGTGIVHTSPTFGADDALVAKQATPEVPALLVKDENDNLVPTVDLQGKFIKQLGELGGKYVKNEYYDNGEAPEKSVDVEIAIKLKEENKAFKVEKYVHSYPNCWRTDKPVLYYPLDSWFIKVTDFKDRMHELNGQINWKPKATGEGRFGNWLANANDWNLSRSRFWGIPLPIWRTEDGKEEIIIGSIEELKSEMRKAVEAGVLEADVFADFVVGDMSDANYEKVDLHKNIVDEITLVSPSGKPMHRESDLIDVWFDSGSMPYAQWHYPFEKAPQSDHGESPFKADFIAEGVDQTRGWFYTLHAIATMIFDDVAYKNVMSNGLVLDKKGQKMSKRLGNAVDPFSTLKEHGPDATRWYMISNANPWDNLKFDNEGITEVRRKFFGTLYNTNSFFSLYANIDKFDPATPQLNIADRSELDCWILSELNTLIEKTDAFYSDYEPTKAARAISDFVQEHLSNWFVRLSRRRFWKQVSNQTENKKQARQDKLSAYQTLHACLITVAQLSAPIAPFFSDRLYKDLTAYNKDNVESVHLAAFPVSNPELINKDLERKMKKAQDICSLVLSLRQKEKIKVRQPLQKIMIPVLSETEKKEIMGVSDLIKREVNVKEIRLITEDSNILVKKIKPNFKSLGPRFGKDMKLIANKIQSFDQQTIKKLEQNRNINIEINNKIVNLEIEDVEISSQDIEGWLVANAGSLTVALDISITPDLKQEGIARELVNRIQNIRKDSGFEVTDRIHITFKEHQKVREAIENNEYFIKNETLTESIEFSDDVINGNEIAFDDIATQLIIKKQ